MPVFKPKKSGLTFFYYFPKNYGFTQRKKKLQKNCIKTVKKLQSFLQFLQFFQFITVFLQFLCSFCAVFGVLN